MLTVPTAPIADREVTVPGSKSYTHRILLAAALSDGPCWVDNALRSEDTRLTMAALTQLGIGIRDRGDTIEIQGGGGSFRSTADPIDLGNSGTSLRLLTALAILGRGRYVLTGSARMCERPIGNLVDSLVQMGVQARNLNADGCPPVEVWPHPEAGGKVSIDCHLSSQYLSGLLLTAPCLTRGLDISVSRGPVSKPYVDMTVEVMQRLGIDLERSEYSRFRVPGGQTYRAGRYAVEPDCSQASYFWSAAAITGACVMVKGIAPGTRQGDIRFVEVLERMGCRTVGRKNSLGVCGGPLRGVEVDMGDMPDTVPSLAIVAAFAAGTTVMKNVGHLRVKESDRLQAVATELGKMGIEARCDHDSLTVVGGHPRAATIDTYDDHRMAMSFAVAGLVVPGMVIRDEQCVSKSFPNFWQVFEGLYASGSAVRGLPGEPV